jgi:glycosyltransferase involved in cell wall biosynthesis
LLLSDRNAGPGSARNRGWDTSNCDYIAFLDADDVWHPRKLEIQVREMERNSSFSMSCHERIVSVSHSFPKIDDSIVLTRELSLNDFIVKNRCSTPTVMVRSTLNERYKNEKRHAEDYLLWMTIIAKHGSALHIHAPLAHCTNPGYGGSGQSGRLWKMERSELSGFVSLWRSRALSLPTLVAVSCWSIAKYLLRLFDTFLIPIRRRR